MILGPVVRCFACEFEPQTSGKQLGLGNYEGVQTIIPTMGIRDLDEPPASKFVANCYCEETCDHSWHKNRNF